MATFSAPFSQAGTVGTWGKTFEFIGDALIQELAEAWDISEAGILVPVGTVNGTGTLTLRQRYHGGIGPALTMAAMASETEAITPSSMTGNVWDTVVARYGLGFDETFQRRIVQSDGVTLDQLAASIAQSWISTVRSLVCTSGASISSSAVDSSAALDLDDWALVVAAFTETEGANGDAVAVLHPEQVTDLRAALRDEPGVYNDGQTWQGTQAIMPGMGLALPSVWGIPVYQCFDVTTGSSKHNGFVTGRGCFGLAVGDPSVLMLPEALDPQVIAAYGLLIAREVNARQALQGVTANAWLGIGRAPATVVPQFLIKSEDN